MRFSNLVPMLQTRQMGQTIDWYESVLGFSVKGRMGDEWCCLARDDISIMFMNNENLGEPAATATQYIYMDDVTGLWDAIKADVSAEWGPEEYDYGMLEFAIRDPNGYLLSFGQPVD
ncbi:MAG: VOC family protein [Pseudomonadota bacterium]